MISTSGVRYGKCPQCGESYMINGEPHFCPPKKCIPSWLKSEINNLIKETHDHSDGHVGRYWLNRVLSLDESKPQP